MQTVSEARIEKPRAPSEPTAAETGVCRRPACPACGGPIVEIRQKLQCGDCHTIIETCCEGGRG